MPPFNEYYAPVDGAAPDVQRYFDWFVEQVKAGSSPDVEGNVSYLFAYIYEVIERFIEDRDYPALAKEFEFLRARYSDTKIPSYLNSWQSDAAMLAGDWDEAWLRSDSLDPNAIRTIGVRTFSRRIRAADVARLAAPMPTTDWGRRRRSKVLAAVDVLLDALHDEAGENFVDAFCAAYEDRYADFSEIEIESLADDLDYGLNSESIRKELREAKERPGPGQFYDQRRTRTVFNGVPVGLPLYSFGIDFDDTKEEAVPPNPYDSAGPATVQLVGLSSFAHIALQARARWIVREAENIARIEAGVPRIGDGWISETELFNLVSEALPGVRVTRHSRPAWLAPQHLDVYLPEANIGIEFQGEQHYRPVDFFGGEANFIEQVRRDERKRKLCKKNGCLLIEVAAGYDADELLDRLRREVAVRRGFPDA